MLAEKYYMIVQSVAPVSTNSSVFDQIGAMEEAFPTA